MSQIKKNSPKKQKTNMYLWMHKNKKVVAGVICAFVILGMLAGLLQV